MSSSPGDIGSREEERKTRKEGKRKKKKKITGTNAENSGSCKMWSFSEASLLFNK